MEPYLLDKKKWQDDSTWILGTVNELKAQEIMLSLKSHVWIKTSGSSSYAKWVGLSKSALLNSAESVNKLLGVQPTDQWLCILPTTHVGGLSIFCRAALSGGHVHTADLQPWDPSALVELVKKYSIQWTSIVPTQLHDIIKNNLISPSGLKGVLVGGGHLTLETYRAARKMGWPIIPTFGMTEASSQVATAPVDSDESDYMLTLLPHWQARTNSEGLLELKGESLFTAYCIFKEDSWQLLDPKSQAGWWTSEDFVHIFEDQTLQILGRKRGKIKVSGYLVDLNELGSKWNLAYPALKEETLILDVPDNRRENSVILVSNTLNKRVEIIKAVESWNQEAHKPEKLRNVYFIKDWPRNELGKISTTLIRRELGF